MNARACQLICHTSHSSSHLDNRVSKRRLASQFNDLQRCYLRLRHAQQADVLGNPKPAPADAVPLPTAKRKRGSEEASDLEAAPAAVEEGAQNGVGPRPDQRGALSGSRLDEAPVGNVGGVDGLQEFARMLSTFTRCSKLKVRCWTCMVTCIAHMHYWTLSGARVV